MPARYAAGVDIGGTKIYVGIINLDTGEVVNTARKRTHPERGVDFFTQRLQDVIASAIDGAKLPGGAKPIGMGVGIAGQVDRERGVILGAPNLAQGLVNLEVGSLLSKRFGIPAVIGNDVEVAALGELHYGNGRDTPDFVYVSVGTGVGGAIVRDGRIYRGTTGTAGEIGHTIVQYDGRFCGCGGRGHLEAYASRTAVTRVLQAEMSRGRKTKLRDLLSPDDPSIRSKMLAKCVDDGDDLVTESLIEAADYLGAAVASLATFYNPPRVILGGGLIEAIPMFFDHTVLRTHEATLPVATRNLDIRRTALGDNAGIVGAATLADPTRRNGAVPAAAAPARA
jgi:glucokinase